MQDSRMYAKCTDVKKEYFVNEGDEETVKALAASYDIPPLFESGMFERSFMKHYSLNRYKFLACRWREYVMGIELRRFSPFQLPDIRELHFYNGAIRFLPAESIRHQDHRFKLKPGPGVDNKGQMPIPQEALMKRGTTVKNKTDKRDRMTDMIMTSKEKGAKIKKTHIV